jgi:hypothetical protein
VNLETLLPLIMKFVLFVAGFFGGVAGLETTLENYIMDHVPQWAKGFVVPVFALLVGIATNIYGGMGVWLSVSAALATWGATVALHNSRLSSGAPALDPRLQAVVDALAPAIAMGALPPVPTAADLAAPPAAAPAPAAAAPGVTR